MKRLIRTTAGFLLTLCSVLLCAQTVTGTFVGTVTDASGGAVPKATVTLRNIDTNKTTVIPTDNDGNYSAANLQPGNYEVSVAATGYRTTQVQNVRLLLDATQRTDVKLDVGSVESVEVSTAPPEISTDTSSIATVIDMKAAEDLPLNGRTVDRLILLVPGSTGESSSAPNIGGSQHWGGTYFTVDGGAFNDVGNGGGAYSYATNLTTMPSTEVIQDMKVESNLAKAESEAGSSISILTKSGTNRFHGALYEFNRNRAFAARDYFARVGVVANPPFNRNEFGFIFSGPIWRDRTFFFASAEYLLQRTSRTTTMSVATDAMRQGNFTGVSTVKNPYTGVAFPGNQLPSIDPRATALLTYYPHTNLPGSNAAGTANNLVQNVSTKYNVSRYGLKFDHQITNRNQLTVGGNYSVGDPYSIAQGTPSNYGNWANAGYFTQSAFVRDTATIAQSMVNEARIGYFSHRSVRFGQNTDFDPTTLFPTLYGPLPIGGLPTVNISGYTKIGDYGGAGHNFTTIIQPTDNFTWQHGKHTFKTGANISLISLGSKSAVGAASLGTFSVDGRYTGNAFADFLMGYLSSDVRATPSQANTTHYEQYGFYAQDDWQVHPRLTLNLGFRYNLQTTPRQRDGDLTNFDPVSGKFVIRSVNHQLSPDAANSPAIKRSNGPLYPYIMSEDNGWGSTMLLTDKKDFGPRVGFAFRPYGGQATVIRGGYGIYYNFVPFFIGPNQLTTVNYPFALTETFTATSGSTPSLTFANPFPGTGTVTANPTAYMVDRQEKNARIQQWNLTVEQVLPGKAGLRITYLGNRGTQVPWYGYNINLPVTQQATSAQYPTLQSMRPFQPWGDISSMITKGKAFTNQMQVVINKRTGNGLFLQASFTWNKSMDNVPVSGTVENPYRPQDDWGLADTQRNKNLYIVATYELPFKGHGFKGGLVSGWSLSTMTASRSGLPFTPTFTAGTTGWYATRASIVPGVDPYAGAKTLNNWFNKAAFATPAKFTFGNGRRNMLFGPAMNYSDISAQKRFRILDRADLQLRFDAFNIFNHPNFANPAANISVATVGTISGTSSAEPNRQIQLGGKIRF